MRMQARITVATCCCLIAAGAFLLAQREPRPGPASWLTELAGDWTIRVEPGGYLLGNALDGSGQAVLYGPDHSAEMRELQGDVLAYAASEQGILMQITGGYAWLAAESRDPLVSADVAALPAGAGGLQPYLRQPAPSYRTRLTALAVVCGALGVSLLLAAAFKRTTASVSRANPSGV